MLITETSHVDSPWNWELENGFSSYVTFVASTALEARNLAARTTPSRSHLATLKLARPTLSARKSEAAMQWRENQRQSIHLFCAPIFRKPIKRGERNQLNSTWSLLEKYINNLIHFYNTTTTIILPSRIFLLWYTLKERLFQNICPALLTFNGLFCFVLFFIEIIMWWGSKTQWVCGMECGMTCGMV